MKIKPGKVLIICATLLVLYVFAGHDVVTFYVGGKSEILEAGNQINALCNVNGACPATLEGWEKSAAGNSLAKGSMLYFVDTGDDGKDDNARKSHQTFKLVYRFSMPDDWYEVKGGVGKHVTAGWAGR